MGLKKCYYSIVGPKTIRDSSDYNVSVTSEGYTEAIELEVGINGTLTDNNGTYNNHQLISLDPGTTKLVTLKIGKISPGDYKLYGKSTKGETIEKDVELGYNNKRFNAFIQTDKSMYKPGDQVKFRVVFLDANLKGVKILDNCKIYVTDANEHRIKQWKDIPIPKGVFTNEFQLSDNLNLGNWLIHVEVDEFKECKLFEVQEYVLPKYEVRIVVPSKVSLKDGKIVVIIYSKYTNGQYVKGRVKVVASYGGKSPGNYCLPVNMGMKRGSEYLTNTKIMPTDGKAVVEYTFDELELTDSHIRQLNMEATVTEELTQTEMKSLKTSVELCSNKYNLKLKDKPTEYIDGMTYTNTVVVQNLDGSPVTDKKKEVKIFWQFNKEFNFGQQTEISNNENQTLTHNQHGMVETHYTVPLKTSTISYTIKYLDEEITEHVQRQSIVDGDKAIQGIIRTENPTIDNVVEIDVLSSIKLTYFSYLVFGRGNILQAKTVKMNNEQKTSFTLQPSFEMVPKSKIVVFYVAPTGKYVHHTFDLNFPSAFRNPVNIELSKDQAQPGENIDINVKSNPMSFFGLLGIDQSVALLKSGNDFDANNILDSLNAYKTSKPPSKTNVLFGYRHPTNNTENPFKEAEAVVLSNTYVEKFNPEVQNYPTMARSFGGGGGGFAFGAASMAMSNTQSSGLFGSPTQIVQSTLLLPPPPPAREVIELKKPIVIRKDFPETWIFEDIEENSSNGNVKLTKKVPDTMTSWMISGFSIDPVYGFGMTNVPRKLEVFQPFFVSLKLPYSIKRGETLTLPVVVFNYMTDDVDATVTLENKLNEFEFIDSDESTKTTNIKSNDGSTVNFQIRPRKVGHITIKVIASSNVAGDGVERQLLVESEGVTQFLNTGCFVDLRENSSYLKEICIEIPENAIPDSTKINFSVIGDVLGTTITNLDKLIRLPYGCGEQNMLNFVPNIMVLDYLTITNKLIAQIKAKSIKYMEQGYQRELSYKHPDGSYSAFGPSGGSKGSTWLTAFVVKSFRQAKDYIDIDEGIIKQAFDFLSSVQESSGYFAEKGTIFHKDMQGGSGSGLALTAYVLIAFMQNEKDSKNYKDTIGKGVEYVLKEIYKTDDIYSLALSAYVLLLAKHPQGQVVFEKLRAQSQRTNDLVWWTKPLSNSDKKTIFSGPKSVDIELTSYAIHAFIANDMISETIPIMKWLIGQRNEDGGFVSTQDTVVGIGALAKIAEKMITKDTNVNLVAKWENGKQSSTFNVNKNTESLLQSEEISSDARKIVIEATGTGFAIAQVSYKYNIEAPFEAPRFDLKAIVAEKSRPESITLKISTNYVPRPADGDLVSNMAVMEIKFPSGFVIDPDILMNLKNSNGIKKVETKDSDTIVFLYFNNLSETPIDLTVCGMQQFKVADQKPAPITVYDYYDNSKRARIYYIQNAI